jgi:hypothetical protein
MKTKTILIFLVLFGIVGYLRERFFEHINIIYASVYRGKDEYAVIHVKMPWIMIPFSKMSYPAIYYSKYIFTVIWIAIFFTISFFALKKLSQYKNILKILIYSYSLLLILAGISMLAGYIINNTLKNDEYTLSRWLLGIAQSPIICLILLASQKLNSKSLNL